MIAARGSSDNAARYAQHVLGRLCGLPVALASPSLHTVYDAPLRYDGGAAIGISQSGASPDVVAVLDAARDQGRPAIAITNDADSPLARGGDARDPAARRRRGVGRGDEDLHDLTCRRCGARRGGRG